MRFNKIDINEASLLASAFVKSTLGSYIPDGKCFTVSYPLSIHLENNGFKNSLSTGKFKFGSPEQKDHFWIAFEDEDKTIIDPTIKQFFTEMPDLYIGKRPTEYTIESTPYESWFKEVYKSWIGNFEFRAQLQLLSSQEYFDIILDINVKAAIIINNDIELKNTNMHVSQKLDQYLYGIYCILINYTDQELTKFRNLLGYDKLVARLNNEYSKRHITN
ncbi:MAG: hypothetical protein Q8L81_09055 [Bacteroidota bacterium]|nr:hypothetical protein [Bacteroidota bacterium]